jgi:hypothetical protein
LHKSVTLLARWSKKFRWQERIAALNVEDVQRAIQADKIAKLNAANERERLQLEFQQRAIAASEKATQRGLEILDQPLGNSRPEHAARLLAVGDAIGARALGLPAGSSDGFRTFRVITYVNRGEHGTPPPPGVASADADVKVGFTVPKGKSIKDLLTFPRGKGITEEEAKPLDLFNLGDDFSSTCNKSRPD